MTKKKAETPEQAAGSRLSFLVVDDDEGARQILVDYLHSFGYSNIIEAKDGSQALEILRSRAIDMIISDWEMPNTSGLDLLRVLKTDPLFRHIPFIMVTSPISHEQHKIEDAAASDVDGYIIKPFRAEILREKIDRALSDIDFQGRKGVLVVDDDHDVRSTIVEYLKKMGFDPIFEAADGDEGFACLQINANKIAFVLSDWEMPKLAGIDLLKRIREDKVLSTTPFIMVTSQTSIERVKLQNAIQASVDHYLLKPFKVDDLKTKVEQVLQKARAQVAIDRDLSRGRKYLDEGKWADALKTFNLVLTIDPKCIEAFLGLATAQKHIAPEKAIPKATQYIRQAIAIDPTHAQSHIDLALIFESAMSIEKAISCLKDAQKTCGWSEEIYYHLGRLLMRRGLLAEGRKALMRTIELCPDHKQARELLETSTVDGGKNDNK